MQAHEARDSLAVDMKSLLPQLLGHSAIAIIWKTIAQFVQAQNDLLFKREGRGRAM
jgi:hypothetical protein